MSGGSLNYAYHGIEDAALSVRQASGVDENGAADHLLFAAAVLRLAAKVAKDTEWYLSCDTGADELSGQMRRHRDHLMRVARRFGNLGEIKGVMP